MGFYGNITNTARTQFQFDKIYPNKVEMERASQRDGVYLGRYVLIEYDSEHHRDSYERVWFKSGSTTAYKSDNYESNTAIKNGEAEDNPIVVVYGEKEDKFYAWQKPENYDSKRDASKIAVYDEIVSSNDSQYTINYVIDLNAYKASRGYDSTVWQKVYNDGVEKYVMIAELNTVVPTFDVSADAPTMSPITPHFDTRSTDVYYKLHWQAPWGFRLAAANSKNQSDLKTQWVRHSYNKDNGITIAEYYYPEQEEWKADKPANNNIDAAIYFNAAGFNEDVPSYIEGMNNEIKITLGQSGNEYNKHDGSIDVEAQDDTQELTINLPGIGNMMSKAWDIIHGPNRDDDMRQIDPDTGNYVASLRGRLLSIDAIDNNQIPIKRIDNGQLVGTKINGDIRDNTVSDTDEILSAELSSSYESDDAWIETKVDADNTPNAIAIHHTYHAAKSSASEVDLNDHSYDRQDSYFKEKQLATYNHKNNNNDVLNFYVPYVDAAGHVVGHNIETVTLPYSYKEFITDSVSNIASGDLHTQIEYDVNGAHTSEVMAAEGSSTADQTQDIMHIDPYNKWIQVDIQDDTIRFAHEVHAIPETINNPTNLNSENGATSENNINIPDWDYDKAGHIIEKHDHYYTLPFSYKTFEDSESGNNKGSSSADNTQDTFVFKGDSWVKPVVTADLLTITHEGPVAGTNTEETTPKPNFGADFTFKTYDFDSKGHKFNETTHTVTIPQGSLTDSEANGADVITQLSFTASTGALITDRTNIGDLKITGYQLPTSVSAEALSATETLNSALGKLEYRLNKEVDDRTNAINSLDYNETANNTQIITQITQADGKITNIARAAAGTLVLGDGYSKATNSTALTASDSLNIAFGKIEKSLDDTKAHITNLIDGLDVSDTPVAGQYVSGVSETNGKISVSRANLPTYTLTSGSVNGTVAFNNVDVVVTGLGSAAYTNSAAYDAAGAASAAEQNAKDYADSLASNYATAEQGSKATTALQLNTLIVHNDTSKTVEELLKMVIDLQAQVIALEAKINDENPETTE